MTSMWQKWPKEEGNPKRRRETSQRKAVGRIARRGTLR